MSHLKILNIRYLKDKKEVLKLTYVKYEKLLPRSNAFPIDVYQKLKILSSNTFWLWKTLQAQSNDRLKAVNILSKLLE